MALLHSINVGKNGMLIVYEIDKEEEYYRNEVKLSKTERLELDSKIPKKKIEWLAVRYAMDKYMIGSKVYIKYDSNGKPSFKNIKNELSISHSGNKIACYIADQPCGVDIQVYSDKIEKIQEKFVHVEERRILNDEDKFKQLHIIWSAKESLYKLYSKGGISFRHDMMIKAFDLTKDEFVIYSNLFLNNRQHSYKIGVMMMDKEVLTWTID